MRHMKTFLTLLKMKLLSYAKKTQKTRKQEMLSTNYFRSVKSGFKPKILLLILWPLEQEYCKKKFCQV